MTPTFVVVGGGVAAAAAVQTLREEGFEGGIVLVGDEPRPPYERPPLSKGYLLGKTEEADLPVHPEAWYAEQAIDLRLGVRATSVDPGVGTVELSEGPALRFDALLLATGGRPRRIVEPSERVHELRTLEDARRIRDRLGRGGRLVVVGSGFIGAEVAASARRRGLEVVVIDSGSVPLERALGTEMGRVLEEIHRDEGVEMLQRARAASVEEVGGGVVVTTTTGARVEGDEAVVGVGIVPNVELAERAGLEVGDGVLVDAMCRTFAETILAAGDVANHDHPLFGRVRVEHFDAALKMGAAAARGMLGRHEPFDHPHWFWSDQYDHTLQMAGIAATWDEVVVRGSVEARDFTAFYLRDGVLRSALTLGRPRDVRRAMRLIGAQARPDPSALRDEDVDLRDLLPAG